MPMSADQSWSEEQRTIIEAPASARLSIEAGPGTGKTDSLIARLEYLLVNLGLTPSNVLVLSFSVAAVKELRRRIERSSANSDTSLAFIELRTFDSFASRLLRQFVPQSELQMLSYDERILRATSELQSNQAAVRSLSEIKHVLLDEMQDLVGVRAEYALTLLRTTQPGFTLFGDSAQGIYDFTMESSPSRTTSTELMQKISAAFPDLNNRHRFTKNFRVGGNPQLETIASQGRTLLLESSEKARAFLERKFAELDGQGSTGSPNIDGALLYASTCVVCRTNGQVLRLAGQLQERGIPFQIARDKNEYLVPAWIGRVFLGWPDPVVRRQGFVTKTQAALGTDTATAQKLWKELIAAFLPPGKSEFNINELRAALTDGVIMPEHPLYDRDNNIIQLSTIHRSKGRDFNNVIVVMPAKDDSSPVRGEDQPDQAAEPRVLFVALTRAKSSLRRMEAKAKGIWMPDIRWIKSYRHPNGLTALTGLQVGLERDVDFESFARGGLEDVQENQQWLMDIVRPGTKVELWLESIEERCPMYRIMINRSEVVLHC